MKNALLVLTICVCVVGGCRRRGLGSSAAVFSPSGKYKAAVTVNRYRTDRTKYLCLNLHLSDAAGAKTTVIHSSASDTAKWALGWMPNKDIAVLYSADIGPQAYQAGPQGIFVSREVTEEIISRADQLKLEKYGD